MAGALAILGISWLLTKSVSEVSSSVSSSSSSSSVSSVSSPIKSLLSMAMSASDLETEVSKLTPIEITQKLARKEIQILKSSDYPKQSLIEKAEQTVDYIREYKDLSTDIVVKLFLSSDKSMFNFLKLVYTMFYNSLEEYKTINKLAKWDVFFVYKGGNVIRIIANDFLKELPRTASFKLNKHYEQFFKRSDADFSIYIDPKINDYDRVYSELTTLSYLLQVKIRQEFMSDLTKYFEFFKYETSYQVKLLGEYYTKVVESKALKDINNATFYNKEFNGIVFDNAVYPPTLGKSYVGATDKGIQEHDAKNNIMYEINSKPELMIIQANETLDFPAAGNRTKFNLVRTKINYNYYFNNELKQIGGELIDVSLPHRLDHNLPHFFEHNDNINLYELEFGKDTLKFYSYTLNYLIADLEYILFKFVALPWLTPKYEKRLNRLFYLYFIDIFIQIKQNNERKTIINKLLNNIFSIKLNINTLKMDIENIQSVINSVDILDSLEITKLLDELTRITNNMLSDEHATSENVSNYNSMMDVFIENSQFLVGSFEGVDQYCSVEGNINMKVLYKNDFSSLI